MKRFVISAVLFLAIAAGVAFLLYSDPEGGDDERAAAVTEPEAAPVRVLELQKRQRTEKATFSGQLLPWEISHITGQTGQRIDAIFVDEGESVRRGQLIARMDGSNLAQAQVELRTAQTELDRMRRLVDIGAVARQQLDQAQARYDTAQSNVEMLRENTDLTAPIAGEVTEKYFVAGEQFAVSAQAPAIVTIQQLDRLKLVVSVPERHYGAVREGMAVSVAVDAYPDREFAGQVQRRQSTINVESRTFAVEVTLDNSDRLLSPGMTTRATLDFGVVEGVFVPRSAIQSQPGADTSYVYIVDDGRAKRREVTRGPRFEEAQQILSGLSPGDQVVTEGISRLSQDRAVTIVEESP